MANIFETLRAEHEYKKFVSGIESLSGLVDTLSGPGSVHHLCSQRCRL